MNIQQSITINIVGLVIAFLLGRMSTWINSRKETYKERLSKLYVPLVTHYDRTHCASARDFTDLTVNDQETFFSILVDNMVYAGDFFRNRIIEFMMYYYNYKRTQTDIAKHEVNHCYNEINDIAVAEWHSLRNKLYWNFIDRLIEKLRIFYKTHIKKH